MCTEVVATHVSDPIWYPFLPSVSTIPLPAFPQLHSEGSMQTLEVNLFAGDLVYEYLARETNGTSGPHVPDWPINLSSTDHAYGGFAALFPMFVPSSSYFLWFAQHRLSGMTFRPPPRPLLHHSPRSRSPHNTADNHLPNRGAGKAHPRSVVPKESGAVACARMPSTISTNVGDTLRTWESDRCVSPVGKSCAVGGIIGNGIIPSIARGWISGGTGILGLRMLLPRSMGRLRRPENGCCGDVRFCPNFWSRTEAHSVACYFVYRDFSPISFRCPMSFCSYNGIATYLSFRRNWSRLAINVIDSRLLSFYCSS